METKPDDGGGTEG